MQFPGHKTLLLMLFCAVAIAGYSQNGDIDILKHDAAIFRGPVKGSYPYYFTGTPYLHKAEFEKNSLRYNKKWYYNVKLNLDICRDELCVNVPNSNIIIVLDNSLVNEFTINGRKFVNIGNSVTGTQNRLCELIYEGICAGSIIKESVKKYNRPDNATVVFYTIEKLYILKGDNAYRIKGIRTFRKVYPHMKKEINKYVRTLDFSNTVFLYSNLMKFIDTTEAIKAEEALKGGDTL